MFEESLHATGDYGALSEDQIKDASKGAHVLTNTQLHRTEFDDTLSGTTAISVLLKVRSLSYRSVLCLEALNRERVARTACLAYAQTQKQGVRTQYFFS